MPEPNSGCLLWLGYTNPKGYGTFGIGAQKDYAHRAAWRDANGPIPDKMFVCHKCDIPSCVNPDHLFLGTHQENVSDMVAKNRHLYGVRHNRVKLTDAQVREIRLASGSQQTIAVQFGVTQTLISMIKRRTIWKHLQ